MYNLFNLLNREQRKQVGYLTEWNFVHMKELLELIKTHSINDITYETLSASADIAIEEFRESLRVRYNRHYMQLDWLKGNYENEEYDYLIDKIEIMFLYYIGDKYREEILHLLESGQVDIEDLFEQWKKDCRQAPMVIIRDCLR